MVHHPTPTRPALTSGGRRKATDCHHRRRPCRPCRRQLQPPPPAAATSPPTAHSVRAAAKAAAAGLPTPPHPPLSAAASAGGAERKKERGGRGRGGGGHRHHPGIITRPRRVALEWGGRKGRGRPNPSQPAREALWGRYTQLRTLQGASPRLRWWLRAASPCPVLVSVSSHPIGLPPPTPAPSPLARFPLSTLTR